MRAYSFYANKGHTPKIVISVPGLNNNTDSRRKFTDRRTAITRGLFSNRIIERSKRRKMGYNVSVDFYNALIHQPCNYCGIIDNEKEYDAPARTRPGKVSDTVVNHNTIDRIDSNIGYMKDNVVSSCLECNRAKSDRTQEEFESWLQQLYNHFVKSALIKK